MGCAGDRQNGVAGGGAAAEGAVAPPPQHADMDLQAPVRLRKCADCCQAYSVVQRVYTIVMQADAVMPAYAAWGILG